MENRERKMSELARRAKFYPLDEGGGSDIWNRKRAHWRRLMFAYQLGARAKGRSDTCKWGAWMMRTWVTTVFYLLHQHAS